MFFAKRPSDRAEGHLSGAQTTGAPARSGAGADRRAGQVVDRAGRDRGAGRVDRPARRGATLLAGPVTIDMDTTDTETYGRTKLGVSYNHTGQRVGRTHAATWAQAGTVLALDLRDGTSDPRTYSPELMERALTGLAR